MKFEEHYNAIDLDKLITEDDVDELTPEKKSFLELGMEIAKKLGITFNGVWDAEGLPGMEDLLVFTDPKSHGTFTAKSEPEARKKFKDMITSFASAAA